MPRRPPARNDNLPEPGNGVFKGLERELHARFSQEQESRQQTDDNDDQPRKKPGRKRQK
jgi:hypothetical protein